MIKKMIKKIIYPNTYSSEAYVNFLRKKGCKIGDNTFFWAPRKTLVDVENAIFIKIGDGCKITSGVVILAHDYSYSVLRPIYHEIPKRAKNTIIGNNVFIGLNSIILMGTEIGDNVIIGAGSVVSGKIPSNEVWAGNPAKFICTLDDYYKKCCNQYEKSIKITIKQYNDRLKRNPSIQELQYFSTMFLNNFKNAKGEYEKMKFNGDNKKEVVEDCLKIKSKFSNYDSFIEYYKRKD